MNYIELKKHLTKMCEIQNIYNNDFCTEIINTILKCYCTVSGYYEEDATTDMRHFLSTGSLKLSIY